MVRDDAGRARTLEPRGRRAVWAPGASDGLGPIGAPYEGLLRRSRNWHVSQILARFEFHVPQRGQVTPLPATFAINNATPMGKTNPNVTKKTPSNVRQAVTSRLGAGSQG